MPRRKEPINILEGKKRTHLTNEQKAAREAQEKRKQPPTDKVRPPTWLSKPAKKEFRIMAGNLQRLQENAGCNIISNLDVPLLAMWANAYVEYQLCSKEIDRVTAADNKAPVARGLLTDGDLHPLLTQKKRLFEQMEKIGRQFGLSPSARLSITLPPKKDEPESKWNKFKGESSA